MLPLHVRASIESGRRDRRSLDTAAHPGDIVGRVPVLGRMARPLSLLAKAARSYGLRVARNTSPGSLQYM